jgi:hypothetical protein
MAKVSIFYKKICGNFGRTKIFETASWFSQLLLACNHIAQFRFHRRNFGSRIQAVGPAILKRLVFALVLSFVNGKVVPVKVPVNG